MVLTLRGAESVSQDSFDFSDAKVNMQSNKVTLDDTVSVATRRFSGSSLLLNRRAQTNVFALDGKTETNRWRLLCC